MPYSLLQLEAIQKIVAIVDHQEQLCADLKLLLVHATPILCRAYQIPRTLKEDEGNPIKVVQPTPLAGEPALAAALKSLNDWYGVPQYSTKVVNRTPGAIVIANVDEDQVLKLVSDINRCKAAIEELTPSLGSRDDRFELLHRHLPWLILPQLTRQLQVLPSSPPLQSCTFTWGIKTEIKTMTKDQVCERLEAFRKRPRQTTNDVPWDMKIDQEIMAIRSLPASAELRSRRPLRVRPLANLRYHSIDDQAPETYLREAHTPILILNPVRRVKVGTLKSYSVLSRLGRDRVKGRGEYQKVCDLLPIYWRKQ